MPRMLGARRPLILTMGGIKKETIGHIGRMRSQWLAPVDILVHSYTKVSNMPGRGETLEMLWPDPAAARGLGARLHRVRRSRSARQPGRGDDAGHRRVA
jgi:hypothetical protein